jgi:hypothetical protein
VRWEHDRQPEPGAETSRDESARARDATGTELGGARARENATDYVLF